MRSKSVTERHDVHVRPDLSVIIPSYNCADLVGRAIESAYAFTERPVEVLVVDDGSTDGTADVLATLLTRFPALHVIRQVNGGLSSARNTGIRHAKGRYVALLDADDELLPMGSFPALDVEADVLRIGLEEIGMDGSILRHVETPFRSSGLEYLAVCFNRRAFYTPSCAYVYRLDWLRSNNLRFVNGLIHEDILFTVEALLHCRHMAVTDSLAYRYFRRAESITKMVDDVHTLNRINSLFRICAQLTTHANANPEIDLSWWILHNIEYAASLAARSPGRMGRWKVLCMEVRFFILNRVWKPYRTRNSIRFRLRQRVEEWVN